MSRFKVFIVVLIGVISVSFASIFIKLIPQVPALVIAFYRLFLATLFISPVYALKGGRLGEDFHYEVLAGLFMALHFAFWISSLKYTSVLSSVVLVTMNPVFVGILSWIFLKEKPSLLAWTGIFVSLLGGLIVGYSDRLVGLANLKGDILSILGSIMISIYFLIGRRTRKHAGLIEYVFPVYLSASVFLYIFCVLTGTPIKSYPVDVFKYFVLLALIPQIIGHTSFNWALKHTSATFVTVLILGEPIGSAILAYLILGEGVKTLQVVGSLFILAGIVINYFAEGEEPAVEPL